MVGRTVLLLTITALLAVRCSEVTTREACVKSTDDSFRVTCPGDRGSIQINEVVYSVRNNLSAVSGCDIDRKELGCEALPQRWTLPQLWTPIYKCFGKQECSLKGSDVGVYNCGNERLNHLKMNYRCVQDTPAHHTPVSTTVSTELANSLINLCGNLWRNITTSTQLSNLPESGEVSRDCKCVVTGGQHTVRAISVVFPIAVGKCGNITLTVKSDKGRRQWTKEQFYFNKEIAGKTNSSTIHIVRDCNGSSNTIVRLQITPDPNVFLSLHCENPATTTPHEEYFGKHSTAVVAGSALVGVALVVCLTVLAVFLCKKRPHNGGQDPDDPVSGKATVSTHDGVVEGAVECALAVDSKIFVIKEEGAYGGYQKVGGPHEYHTLEALSPSDTTAVGNPDQPQTPVAGAGMPQTKTVDYGLVRSVPNANKKMSIIDEHRNDSYNTLCTDRKSAGVSPTVDDMQTRVEQGEITFGGIDKRMSEPVYAQVNKSFLFEQWLFDISNESYDCTNTS